MDCKIMCIVSCGVRCLLRQANAFSPSFFAVLYRTHFPDTFHENQAISLIKSPIKTLNSPLRLIWFLARRLNPTYYDKMKLERSNYCCRWKNAFEFRSCKLTPVMWRSWRLFLNNQSPNTVCIRLFFGICISKQDHQTLCFSGARVENSL